DRAPGTGSGLPHGRNPDGRRSAVGGDDHSEGAIQGAARCRAYRGTAPPHLARSGRTPTGERRGAQAPGAAGCHRRPPGDLDGPWPLATGGRGTPDGAQWRARDQHGVAGCPGRRQSPVSGAHARQRCRCDRRRRPADRGRADAGDRRHSGTPTETDPNLLTAGPPLVPAGDVAPPPARQKRAGPPADREAAPGLATWCRASPVDSLRRGVHRRIIENCRDATEWEFKSRAEFKVRRRGRRDGCGQSMNKLVFQSLSTFLIGAVVLGVLLFLPAWTLNYWQAWVFMAVFMISVNVIGLYLALKDPALLERRKKFGPTKEQSPVQKIAISIGVTGTPQCVRF